MWQNQRLPKLEQKSLIARTSPYSVKSTVVRTKSFVTSRLKHSLWRMFRKFYQSNGTAERASEDRTKNIIKTRENEGFIFVFYLKIDEKLCQMDIRDTVLFERCPFFVRFCLNATASSFSLCFTYAPTY